MAEKVAALRKNCAISDAAQCDWDQLPGEWCESGEIRVQVVEGFAVIRGGSP